MDGLKLYLSKNLKDSETLPDKPKPIFKTACKKGISKVSQNQWFKYIDARNDTSHDYSHQKAQQAIKIIDDFIDDAIALYQTMTGQTWE